MKKTIDVSKWNAITNFPNVAASVDGVIIRVGFRGFSNGSLELDPRFLPYANELSRFEDLKLGAYFTSAATTTAEAVEEANFMVEMIKSTGKDFKLPIFVNSDWGTSLHAGRADELSPQERTTILIAFVDECFRLGYECGIFATDAWFTNKLELSRLNAVMKYITREGDKTEVYNNNIANKYLENHQIKGLAGYINMSFWTKEDYWIPPKTLAEMKAEEAAAKAEEETKEEVEETAEIKASKKRTSSGTYQNGMLLKLSEEPVFKTSIASTILTTVSGKYYVYNTRIINRRIRIMDKKTKGNLIGWINLPDDSDDDE